MSVAATRCRSSQALKIAAARTYRRTVLVAYPRVMSTSTKSSTQRPNGPDRIWSQMRGRTESVSKHGLLLGPLTLGTRRDHAYYVKLAVAPMPATPGATALG